MNENLQSVLISGIGMGALIIVLAVLFWRLKDITWYNVAIFVFISIFWTMATLIKKAIYNDNPYKTDPWYTHITGQADGISLWIWPLAFAGFQLIQVIMRYVFARLSKRTGSRKIPIILAASASTISLITIVATHIAPWTIAMGMIAAGFLGSTFGMQNAYFSENFNMRSVYISMGIMAIAPAFSCLSAGFIKAGWKLWADHWEAGNAKFHNNADLGYGVGIHAVDSLMWILIGSIIFMVIVTGVYVFLFKEKRETIGLDNIHENDHQMISKLQYRDIFRFATLMFAMSFGFNIVTAGGTSQEQTTVWVSPEFELLTLVGIAISLVTALWLARVFHARYLLLLGDMLVFIGLLLALYAEWTGHGDDKVWWLSYLIVMTLGFNIFQNTYLGVAMHMAHKNPLKVLPAIFCIRSFMYGTGQMTGEYIRMKAGKDGHEVTSVVVDAVHAPKGAWYASTNGGWTQNFAEAKHEANGEILNHTWVPADYLKWVLIPALVISVISMLTIFFSYKNHKMNMIFTITDKYEYRAFKEHRKDIWKPINLNFKPVR